MIRPGVERLAALLTESGVRSAERVADVVALTRAVAQRSGMSAAEVDEACEVASLQDAGRLGVPAGILTGEPELTGQQRYWIGEVPAIGHSMVLSAGCPAALAEAVRAQHERWDGTGYPQQLSGEAIPRSSRITHVCEAYVAMISVRPHRASMSPAAALGVVRMASGTQFCPAAARALVEVMSAVAPVRAAPAPTRRRRPQLAVTILVGGAVGALLALPPKDVTGQCPPAQEGLAMCVLQNAWAPALTIVVACVCAALLLTRFVRRIPEMRRARRSRAATVWSAPDFDADPVLAAASWGLTYSDVAGPMRRPVWSAPTTPSTPALRT